MMRDGIVRIYDGEKNLAGVGFLIAPHKILTIKSVIEAALGPKPEIAARVLVDFPDSSTKVLLNAALINFYITGSYDNSEIAELEFIDPPPEDCAPVNFVKSDDLWWHEFSVDGYLSEQYYPRELYNIRGHLLGVDAVGWIRYQMERYPMENLYGYPIPRGFLGAPVWDYDLKGMVGIFTDVALGEAPQYKNARQRVQKDGLILGAEILTSVIPSAPKILIKNETLNHPNRSRVELALDSLKMKSLTQEKEYIDRLVIELERQIFGKENGAIRVCSVLHPDEINILLDLPAPGAKILVEFLDGDSGLKDKYGILEVKNHFNGTRTQRIAGPTLYTLTAPKDRPDLDDKQLNDSVATLQSLYKDKIKQMEEVAQKLITLAILSIQEWYRTIDREIISWTEPKVSNQLGGQKLSELNSKIQELADRTPNEVNQRIERRPELWWHQRHGDQHYVLYDNNGRRTPAGEIEKITREIAHEIVPLMKSYGYDCKKTVDTHPYEWSIEMKECYDNYEGLRIQTDQIYRQYNVMRSLKDKNKSIQDARDKWDKTPKRP